jgi:MoxR-like ATPase
MERSDLGLATGAAEQQAGVAHELLGRLGSVVLGQEPVLRDALAALIARGHVLLEGVPGTAKTLLVRSLSLALGLQFRRIQFTPDLMPSDVTGVNVLGASGSFTFRPGPLFGDLVLADEINRAPAKTQAALLEAMQERSVTVDGVSHPLSDAFTVFATQNPIEFEGTYPLPEAELDRFLVKIVIGYPEPVTEQAMLQRVLDGFEADDPSSYGIGGPIGGAALQALRDARRRVRVEPPVLGYITAIVRATRRSPSLTLGVSPRGSVALLKLAQATALLDGRDYVVPDDVKGTAAACLRHRVTVAPELELEGVSADTALRAILEQVDAPK